MCLHLQRKRKQFRVCTAWRRRHSCGNAVRGVCCGKVQSSISVEAMEVLTAEAVKPPGLPTKAPAAPISRAPVSREIKPGSSPQTR